MTSLEDEQEQSVGTAGRASWTTWLLVFLLIVLAFAAAFLYISTEIHVDRVKAQAAANRARLESEAKAERATLAARAAAATTAQAGDLLKVSALPLSWAIRPALQERDYRQIGVYIQELVGIAGVKRVAVVLRDGNIKVSSDKELEGTPAAKTFPNANLAEDSPTIHAEGDKPIEAVVPIMGLNARLGTVIVDYQAPR